MDVSTDVYSDFDGCGYLFDPDADVEFPLVVGGQYDLDASTYAASGVLGPLSNFSPPDKTFPISVAEVIGADDDIFKSARGRIHYPTINSCDPDTKCCLAADLDIFYGCSGPLPGCRETLEQGAGVTLMIYPKCFGPDAPHVAPCETLLRGVMLPAATQRSLRR